MAVSTIYDEGYYYTEYAEVDARYEIMYQEGLTEQQLYQKYSDDDIYSSIMLMRDDTLEEELDNIDSFLSRQASDTYERPNALMVQGAIGRWDGTSSGYDICKRLEDVLWARDAPFEDCQISDIYDEDGDLHIEGYHHDGSVSVTIRQLTDAGEEVLDDWMVDQKPGGLDKIWNNPDLCPKLDYAEKEFGAIDQDAQEAEYDPEER